MLRSLLPWKTEFNRRTILDLKIPVYFSIKHQIYFVEAAWNFRNFTENQRHPRFFLQFIMRNIEEIIRKSEMHFLAFYLSFLFFSKNVHFSKRKFWELWPKWKYKSEDCALLFSLKNSQILRNIFLWWSTFLENCNEFQGEKSLNGSSIFSLTFIFKILI